MKKIIVPLLLIILFLAAVVVYLNQVLLPGQAKIMLIRGIEDATGKKCQIDSLTLHIFKGLVVHGIRLLDQDQTIASAKEVDASFLFLPLFKQRLIIPELKIKSPWLLLERQPDNTFNLTKLIAAPQPTGAAASKNRMRIFVAKVRLFDATVVFEDYTFTPAFSKEITHLNAAVGLSLVGKGKITFRAEVPAKPASRIEGEGTFHLGRKEFSGRLRITDIQPQDFSVYYPQPAPDFGKTAFNLEADLNYHEGRVKIEAMLQGKGVSLQREQISASADLELRVVADYATQTRQLSYSGKGTLRKAQVRGIPQVGVVNDISADLEFNQDWVALEKFSAEVFNQRLNGRMGITDFSRPQLSAEFQAATTLEDLQRIAKEQFSFSFDAAAQGKARITFQFTTPLPLAGLPQVNGTVQIQDSRLTLAQLPGPLEELGATVTFDANQLAWEKLECAYQGQRYTSKGTLTNFSQPGIQLELSSSELALKLLAHLGTKTANVTSCTGRWHDSDFSFSGTVGVGRTDELALDLKAEVEAQLQDVCVLLKDTAPALVQAKPEGKVHATLTVQGDAKKPTALAIVAQLTGPAVKAYGLNLRQVELGYRQQQGIGSITGATAQAYGGTVGLNAKVELNQPSYPYHLEARVEGLKIEELKKRSAG